MATNYFPEALVKFDDVFDGRLKKFGIEEMASPDAKPLERALTDGENVLWIYCNRDGSCMATKYSRNDPSRILEALEQALGIEWLSEHDIEDPDGSPIG